MSKHKCPICEYTSAREWNVERHILTKHGVSQISQNSPFSCEFCSKSLSSKHSLTRHISICKFNSTKSQSHGANVINFGGNVIISEDEQTRLTEKNGELKCQHCNKCYTRRIDLDTHYSKCRGNLDIMACIYCQKVFTHRSNKSRHQQVCEFKDRPISNVNNINVLHPNGNGTSEVLNGNHLVQNNTIQTQNNIQHQTNIGQQIIINSFGNENMKHITPQFIERCIRNAISHGVPDMVRKIHFDPDVPENKNIRIESFRREHLGVYEDNHWMIKDKSEVIDQMIDKVCMVMREYYNGDDGKNFKGEDETEHENFYIYRLLEIMNKIPSTYHPLRRKIFATIVNFCRILEEVGDTT